MDVGVESRALYADVDDVDICNGDTLRLTVERLPADGTRISRLERQDERQTAEPAPETHILSRRAEAKN